MNATTETTAKTKRVRPSRAKVKPEVVQASTPADPTGVAQAIAKAAAAAAADRMPEAYPELSDSPDEVKRTFHMPWQVLSDEEIRGLFPKPVYVPLRQQFPQLGAVKEFADRVCIFSSDHQVLHGVVSSRYKVVDHGQVLIDSLASLERVIGQRPEIRITSLNSGGRMRASVKLPGIPKLEVGVGDLIDVTLDFINSYDGLQRFQTTLGAFRLVCSNGMMIGKRFGGFTARHLPGTTIEAGMLDQRIKALIEQAARLPMLWNMWSDDMVQYDEAEKLLTPHFSKKYLVTALDETRFPKSKWDLYNEMTFESSHRTKTESRRLEMDQILADLFYTTNETARVAEVPAVVESAE